MTEADDSRNSAIVEDEGAYLKDVLQEVDLVRMMNRPVMLTWWLLVANVVLWVAARLWGMWLGDQGLASPYLNAEQIAFFTGMKYNEAIADGSWWRLISSQFVHLDLLHLLFNSYGIWVLGRFLERCYGIRRMLILYIASGAVGAYASFLINPAPAGGASGAVYGLVGAAVVFGIKYRDGLPRDVALALTIGLVPWVVLSLGIGFLETIPMDNAAHIGGLAVGGLLAAMMASRLRQHDATWTNYVVSAAIVGVAVALVATLYAWSDEATRCLVSLDAYAQCYPELYTEIRQAVRDAAQ